jgi:hypothetical protein
VGGDDDFAVQAGQPFLRHVLQRHAVEGGAEVTTGSPRSTKV